MDETSNKIIGTEQYKNTFDKVIAKETKASAEFMNKLIDQLLSNDTYLNALAERILTTLDNKAAANHSHNYNDLNNKPSLGSAATKSATDSVTSGSSALITSGAVYNALNDKAPKNSPTFTGTPKTTPNTNYTTSQLRNIRFGTSVPSSLENGEIFFVY